jgi:DNA-binding MurR/RpiR family transcriptional regulator
MDDQIVEFIIKNKKDVVNLSIQSLAANLFTVPHTIIRLSRKLGYDGYSHLKIPWKNNCTRIKKR